MRHRIYLYSIFILLLNVACASKHQFEYKEVSWHNIAVANDVEIFVDTTNVRKENTVVYAREMRVFTTIESQTEYTKKIKEAYRNLGKEEKAEKWNDFRFCVYNCLYECLNKRFRVLSVEDYDSAGKLIARTTPAKDKTVWLKVEPETVGDYTFFYVCDFGN